MTQDQAAVQYAVAGNIAEVTFNKPKKLNALDVQMAIQFAGAVDAANADDDVAVVIVRAKGRAFVAGGDLMFLDAAKDKPAAAEELIAPMHEALKKVAASPKIFIGALKGAVAGGGVGLALSLDLLVAADNTVFNLAYARVGTSPDCGATWLLPRLIGKQRALELAILCENLDASKALDMGLVNRVVPLEQVDAVAHALAAQVVSGYSGAIGRTKQLVQQAPGRDYGAQLDAERESFKYCASTEAFASAVKRFLGEK